MMNPSGSPNNGVIAGLAFAIALYSSTVVEAGNGDILGVSNALAGTPIADLTQDEDGSYWVLGTSGINNATHLIYHLSPDLNTVLQSIENPHAPGAIPNLTTNRGIAFDATSQTLYVLSFVRTDTPQGFILRETDPSTGPTGQEAVLTPPDVDDGNVFGLTLDPLTGDLFTLDVNNDEVIRFTKDGTVIGSFPLVDKTVLSDLGIRGQGIAVDVENATSRIYTTFGDIFRANPSKLVQWGIETELRTGVEVPLLSIPGTGLTGIEIVKVGQRKRAVVATENGAIYQVDILSSNPVPPSELSCSLTISNQVFLCWNNHGSGAEGSYGGNIQILRNGVPFTTVAGAVTNFTDKTPVEGTSTYSLRASDTSGGGLSVKGSSCEVTVGTGGLVSYVPGPGTNVYDLARDSQEDSIYVTDNMAGRIFVLDRQLNLAGEISSPWPDPGGVAFVPTIELGFPPSTFNSLLAVARSTGPQMRFIELDGTVRTTITLNLNGATNPTITSMTFLVSTDQFAMQESSTGKIYIVESNGTFVQACEPSFLIARPYEHGITYDPFRDTMLSTFEGGFVYELFVGPTCPANPEFELIELVSLGEDYNASGFTGGIQINENTLLVGGRQTNTVYETLIFPFEGTFVRGDLDDNNLVNVTDVVAMTNYLFKDAPEPSCLDAVDANDDGFLDIGDPVYLIFFLFRAAAPPPQPFPSEGRDPTFRDSIGCSQ